MFILLLSFTPRPPLAILLIIHLVPTLLLLRSHILADRPSILDILPTASEVIYWMGLMSIPYAAPLQGLLSAGRSKGGGSLGSYGTKLPRHIEEPACKSSIDNTDISRILSWDIYIHAPLSHSSLQNNRYLERHSRIEGG